MNCITIIFNKVRPLLPKANIPHQAEGLTYVQQKEKACSKLSKLFGIYVAGGP